VVIMQPHRFNPMADIFVSYAKTDRSLASKLVAMLEAEGWKVWWDTSLTIGDDFRNEIMTELGRARAVIVIWTDASIKSDWVRSEAGRAQADRKLIPVKLAHLNYKDLPPPFDVLHTENVGEEDKIRAAVIAQLAKPAVELSAVALLTKGFRYEVLTWVGIVGGALTLFTNLSAVLKLADWARVLVEHWKEWTHAFWLWMFGWLGVHLPPEWTPILSFLLFWSLLTIGQAIQFKSKIKNQPIKDEYQGKSFKLISKQTFACTVLLLLLSILVPFPNRIEGIPLYCFIPASIPVVFARHRLYAAVVTGLMAIFFILLALGPFISFAKAGKVHVGDPLTLLLLVVMCISPLILLLAAPAKAISRRLIFLALGLLLLIALNELSKLGLDVTAPKLQG